jgi:hypothetical protein
MAYLMELLYKLLLKDQPFQHPLMNCFIRFIMQSYLKSFFVVTHFIVIRTACLIRLTAIINKFIIRMGTPKQKDFL